MATSSPTCQRGGAAARDRHPRSQLAQRRAAAARRSTTCCGGAALGDDEIARASGRGCAPGRRLEGGAAGAAARTSRGRRSGSGRHGSPRVDPARELVARDVAADVVRQLQPTPAARRRGWRAAAARRHRGARPGAMPTPRPCATSWPLRACPPWCLACRACSRRRPPGTGSRCCRRSSSPTHGGRAAALALTPFVGWDAAGWRRPATPSATSSATACAAGRACWPSAGSPRCVESVWPSRGRRAAAAHARRGARAHRRPPHRAGAAPGGACATSSASRRSPTGCGDGSPRRPTTTPRTAAARLETDAAAVQVVTVHASKGLEFPVVYVPFGWDRWRGPARPARCVTTTTSGAPHAPRRRPGRPRLRRAPASGTSRRRRARTCGCSTSPSLALARRSSRGTRRRPTRPAARCSRVLLGDFAPGQQPPAHGGPPPRTTRSRARLRRLAGRCRRRGRGRAGRRQPDSTRWAAPRQPRARRWRSATFTRHLDLTWRRTSYTALTARRPRARGRGRRARASRGRRVGRRARRRRRRAVAATSTDSAGQRGRSRSGPDGEQPAATVRRPARPAPPSARSCTRCSSTSTLARRPRRGVRCAACARRVTGRLPGVDPAALAAALEPVLRTPLGPLARRPDAGRDRAGATGWPSSSSSCRWPAATGRRRPAGARSPRSRGLLRRHLPADDPFAGYPAGSPVGRLRGRRCAATSPAASTPCCGCATTGGGPRYLVVDYKTNRLAPPDGR